ncbi:hypothetical protein [Rhodopirellula europaea]|uniref:Uncharacterized protein n=1 Tax=Rhodopirellula europaea 6C TaxID=1263867 RepID=M2A6C5_9BACT|nr:hypothetical protein [Rhodopirellula europaea]EMB16231.1 hypothetical protein RE6C_03059 [Rhodopirellula europaea 6C]
MTAKEKAISLIQTLDDNVSLDEVIDRLYLLRKIELGIAQADAGDVMEHDEFMGELEAEDAQ